MRWPLSGQKIVKRIGADTIREAYAIGVALEDAE